MSMKLLKIIKSFVTTLARSLIKMKSNRGLLANKDISKIRIEKCRSCSEYNIDMDVCYACWCNMSIKTKLIEARCPQKKW